MPTYASTSSRGIDLTLTLCSAYHRTLMWAVWMASMTSHPLALIYGLDFNKWYELVIRRKY